MRTLRSPRPLIPAQISILLWASAACSEEAGRQAAPDATVIYLDAGHLRPNLAPAEDAPWVSCRLLASMRHSLRQRGIRDDSGEQQADPGAS